MNSGVQWTRSPDGWVAGVCKSLAERFQLDPLWVRLIWVLSVLFAGFGLALYVCAALALPRKDRSQKAYDPIILGVCSQLSRRIDLEPGITRLLALGLLVATSGIALVGYFALYFLMPDQEPKNTVRSIPQ